MLHHNCPKIIGKMRLNPNQMNSTAQGIEQGMQPPDMVRSHEPCHGAAVPGPTQRVLLPPIGPLVRHPARLSGGTAGAQVEGALAHVFCRAMPDPKGLIVDGRS